MSSSNPSHQEDLITNLLDQLGALFTKKLRVANGVADSEPETGPFKHRFSETHVLLLLLFIVLGTI